MTDTRCFAAIRAIDVGGSHLMGDESGRDR